MTVYKRLCIERYEVEGVTDTGEPDTVVVQRGQEYTTSRLGDDGTVIVFTRYWLRVPARIFAGAMTLEGVPVPEQDAEREAGCVSVSPREKIT